MLHEIQKPQKIIPFHHIQHTWLKFNPFSGIKLLKEKMNVRISIRNKNPFDIPVYLIEGRLSYKGVHIGNFRAPNQEMLHSGGEMIWEIPIAWLEE